MPHKIMAKCKELQLYYNIREMSSRPSRNSIHKHTRILQLQSRKTHMYFIVFFEQNTITLKE